MGSKKPVDIDHTITDAPPIRPAVSPFAADEKTVHVPSPSESTLNVVPEGPGRTGSDATVHIPLPQATQVGAEVTVDGPERTVDAPPERPRAKQPRPSDTVDAPSGEVRRPHDTLDDPPPSLEPSAPSLPPVASVSDLGPGLAPVSKPAPAPLSLDRLIPLKKVVLDRRWVIGIPILLGLLLIPWAFSTDEAPPPIEPVVLPMAPPTAPKPEALPEVDSAGVFVEVNVAGKIERRPGGKVALNSNPPSVVTTAKGQKLGRTPTEVIAEVGPLELLFENHELGISRTLTINVKPGLGGKETVDFRKGWLDVDAPSGSSVVVDGKAIGTAPVPQQTLFEGRHTVTVIFVDGKKNSRQVTVVGGETLSHLVAAPP